jgi:hypothetical protein
MFRERDCRDSIEAMPHTLKVPGFDVIDQMRVEIARLFGLLGREISTLRGGKAVDRSKGRFRVPIGHAQTFRLFEGLCTIGQRSQMVL